MRGVYLESFFDDMLDGIKSDKNAYSFGRSISLRGNRFICCSGNRRYADSFKRIERHEAMTVSEPTLRLMSKIGYPARDIRIRSKYKSGIPAKKNAKVES